jgi:hypothetical protein
VLSEEGSADADAALAEANRLVEAYGQKLTDAVDLQAMMGEEGESC